MTDQKQVLRDQARKHRTLTNIADEDIDAATAHFFSELPLSPGKIVAGYWPMGREFDPTGILEQALDRDLKCALPVVEQDTRILKFVDWSRETSLTPGPYKIMQPEDAASAAPILPDIVLVPLLAFDRRGYRLGQGGGYYDVTLAALRAKKDIIAIGIGYAAQAVLFPLPIENHDQKMDYILTPKGLQDCRE